MAKFLCITLNPAIDVTLSLPQLQVGKVNRTQACVRHAAGKGLNVAQILKDLGHDVWVTGFLGQDNRTIFDEHFQQQQFHAEFVYVAGQTRENIKIAEADGQMTDLNGVSFQVPNDAKIQLRDIVQKYSRQVDCVVLSGSLPQQFSIQDFKSLIASIQAVNPYLAIDTSGEALKTAILSNPFLIKPNQDELAESFASLADTATQQRQIFDNINVDIPHRVVSMGENGVNWFNPEQDLHASIAQVTVKSTVGAGDTLLAGMLHGLVSDLDAEQTLKHAVALAGHTVSQIGFSLPEPELLQQLQQQIAIRPLANT